MTKTNIISIFIILIFICSCKTVLPREASYINQSDLRFDNYKLNLHNDKTFDLILSSCTYEIKIDGNYKENQKKILLNFKTFYRINDEGTLEKFQPSEKRLPFLNSFKVLEKEDGLLVKRTYKWTTFELVK